MRIPDVNVLLYAYDDASPQHRAARVWLERSLSSAEPTGFAWVTLLGFIRLGTRAAAFPQPLSPGEALEIVESWLAHPHASPVDPGDGHPAILRELLEAAGVAGDLTTDAHLAAIAIERGASLATFDGDFHRFAGLKLEFLR